jgi:hypothetical protein
MGRGADGHLLITPGTPIVLLDERGESDAGVRQARCPMPGPGPGPGPDSID